MNSIAKLINRNMRFLMRCKDVETIEVNPIIFRKLTREDWLHIVNGKLCGYCNEELCNIENGRMIVELYLGKQEHHVSRILY